MIPSLRGRRSLLEQAAHWSLYLGQFWLSSPGCIRKASRRARTVQDIQDHSQHTQRSTEGALAQAGCCSTAVTQSTEQSLHLSLFQHHLELCSEGQRHQTGGCSTYMNQIWISQCHRVAGGLPSPLGTLIHRCQKRLMLHEVASCSNQGQVFRGDTALITSDWESSLHPLLQPLLSAPRVLALKYLGKLV